MSKNSEVGIDNSGDNAGVIVAMNTGTINYQLQNSIKIPSKIATIVKTLGAVCVDEDDPQPLSFAAFKPDEKIQYNCVIKYDQIIREYATYFSQCEDAMNLYDNSNMGSKSRILRCIKNWYLEFKGELLLFFKDDNKQDIEIVRNNADLLIDKVSQKVRDIILQSSNSIELNHEDMDLGITCFVCYCFMKCKILEKPL